MWQNSVSLGIAKNRNSAPGSAIFGAQKMTTRGAIFLKPLLGQRYRRLTDEIFRGKTQRREVVC